MNGLFFLLYMATLGGCVIALRRLLNIRSVGWSVTLVGIIMLLFALPFLSRWFNLIYLGAFFIGAYYLVWAHLRGGGYDHRHRTALSHLLGGVRIPRVVGLDYVGPLLGPGPSGVLRLPVRLPTMILIVVIAFLVRIFAYTWGFPTPDAYHHFQIVVYLLENGTLPDLWPLSLAPVGAAITEPMGLYYLPAFLSSTLGIPPIKVFQYLPIFLGLLSLAPAYLVARELAGSKVATYTVALLAILPAFAHRTQMGFYTGDAYAMLFSLWAFALWLIALRHFRAYNTRKFIKAAFLAGTSIGIGLFFWAGALIPLVIISLATMTSCLGRFYRGEPAEQYTLPLFVLVAPVLIIHWLLGHIYPGTVIVGGSFTAAVFLLACFFSLVALASDDLPTRKRRGVAICGTLILLGVLPSALPTYGLFQGDAVLSTVAEMQPTLPLTYFEKFNLLVFLAPMGLGLCWRRGLGQPVFLSVWAILMGGLMALAVRFSFLAAPPVAILGGITLASTSKDRASALLLVMAVFGAYVMASTPMVVPEGLNHALTFLGQQERGVVLSWWPEGSVIQGWTGFPTVVDSVHGQKLGQIRAVEAVFMEEDPGKVRAFLDEHQVRYVVITSMLAYDRELLRFAPWPEGSFLRSTLWANGTGFNFLRLIHEGDGAWVYAVIPPPGAEGTVEGR